MDPAVTLREHLGPLRLYYGALSGQQPELAAYPHASDPRQHPDSRTTIRLPARVGVFPTREQNAGWYKIALTHRAAHEQAGTFRFSLARGSARFERLIPRHLDTEYEAETDLERFFRLFAHRHLAIELFTVVEDHRLDRWVIRRYPGLRRQMADVAHHALGLRPPLHQLRPRSALAEVLVRLSLGAPGPLSLPAPLADPARQLRQVLAALEEPGATVEDAAEAALRAYSLITSLPALAAGDGSGAPVDLLAPPSAPATWPRRWPEPGGIRLEGDAILETTVEPVDYRDALGFRYADHRAALPADLESIFRLTPAAQGEPVDARAPGDEPPVAGPPQPIPHEHHDHVEDHFHEAQGALDPDAAEAAVYPEWDHRAGAYRPRWCRVREVHPATSGAATDFVERALRAHAHLLPNLRAQLEQLPTEGLRRVRRQQEGDELDLEAAIEALVDLRAGLLPEGDVYVRRARGARDVAVALLVDLSSSTAERIDTLNAATALTRLYGRPYRRILDVERESAALLATALSHVGDAYGLYGFSGTGRADVNLVVLKDFAEQPTALMSTRLEELKPLHTTRMAPAIRHVTAKLSRLPAATKLLMLVTDGRPFDLDYGQEYGDEAEVAYALADTRRALEEAREHRVRSFLLTVDQQGADYLRDLGDAFEYEVLDDATLLPARLLALYRSLTG